jgi:hypothetical protein
MTRYIADYASYQGALTVKDLHRAEFHVVNFKTSHGLTTKAVHPRITAEIASARALKMGLGTFHWLIGNHSGTAQADYAFGRLKALGLTAGTMHTVDVEEQTGSDDAESAPTYAIVRDYVLRMEALLGRPVALYTGDWWWQPKAWDGAKLTPYLMAAPNAGYMKDKRYPGATSAHWKAGYGGWSNLSIMQYAVDTLIYPDGGRSTVEVSKAAMRDEAPWRALTGG